MFIYIIHTSTYIHCEWREGRREGREKADSPRKRSNIWTKLYRNPKKYQNFVLKKGGPAKQKSIFFLENTIKF